MKPAHRVPIGEELTDIVLRSREMYAERVTASPHAAPWWTAVIVTASSARQAERYEFEIHRRRELGKIPSDVEYMVVPDWNDHRIGSGGATIQALSALVRKILFRRQTEIIGLHLEGWWSRQRVLMIHSGGDGKEFCEPRRKELE